MWNLRYTQYLELQSELKVEIGNIIFSRLNI